MLGVGFSNTHWDGTQFNPWAIWEILPTHLSVSSLSVGSLWGSLGALVFLYTGLLIVEAWLMVRFAKLGPSSLGTGAYHHEQAAK